MTIREISCRRVFSAHFVAVILFITFSYYLFVYEYMLSLKPKYYVLALTLFHISLVMLLWSMVQCIISDPGRVPIYWGFFLQEKQTKKRRYCLLCHSFKPQRCHHCSTCQRCVLNMDHHCPWISNCVGFANRKFFMLFLTYIILTIILMVGFMTMDFIQIGLQVIKQPKSALNYHTIIRILGYGVLAAFGVIISIFYKFHIELVLKNSSTLDNLDKLRNPEQVHKNLYDVGAYENWIQVFGNNALLWPFPMFCQSGKPRGDGVQWKKPEQLKK